MTQRGPWSVKGIDNRAREVAREAAREEGMTLGAYLNKLILEEGSDETEGYPDPSSSSRRPPEPQHHQQTTPAPQRSNSNTLTAALDRLTRRIESAEARSTLAITGIDQSVVGLLSRLENAEHGQQAMGNHLEGVIDDVRATYETLEHKVKQIEEDDASANNLNALKALEDALGKLATHVYQESELVSEETNAIKIRVESGLGELTERMDSINLQTEATINNAGAKFDTAVEQAELRTEGAVRHLSERLSTLEVDTADKVSHVEQMGKTMNIVHDTVNGSLEQMQERLNLAEATTNSAFATLENHFNNLDTRLDDVQASATAENNAATDARRQFEARFESLASDLRGLITSTRAELAEEIEVAAKSVDSEVLARLETTIQAMGGRLDASDDLHAQTMDMVGDTVTRVTESVDQRLTANAGQQSRAIEQVSAQVTRVTENLDRRLAAISESNGNVDTDVLRQEMQRFTNSMDERLDNMESRESVVVDQMGSEVEKLAGQLNARVTESEQRSASAIEQVGEQVAGVASRIEQRQQEALKAFSEKLDTTQKRQEARLSSALGNVSSRLKTMQDQSITVISPVQKAITALAQRIEAIEDFAAPPYAERDEAPKLPDMVPPEPISTEIAEPAPGKDEVAATTTNPTPQSARQVEPAIDDISDALFDTSFDEFDDLLADNPPGVNQSKVADEDDAFEPGYQSWTDEANAILDDALNTSTDDTARGESQPEYYADLPPPAGEDAASDLWNDGREEARDADIFGDETDTNSPAPLDNLDEFEASASPFDPPPDTTDEDYMTRARKAALTAADQIDTSAHTKGRKNGKGLVSSGSKRPSTTTISALAVLTIAGAAGTTLYLRGKQDMPVLTLDAGPENTPAPATAAAITPSSPFPIATTTPQPTALETSAPGPADPELETTTSATAEESEQSAALVDTPLPSETPDTAANLRGAPESAAITPVAIRTETPAPEPAPVFEAPTIPARITLTGATADGDPIAQYQQGKQLLADNNIKDGADLIRASADQGLAVAQHQLAILHEQGLGTTRDAGQARRWHGRAAEGGNVTAMYDFASYSANGEGGPQNDQAAAEWFRRAAETGHTDSQYNLAIFFSTGRGVTPSQTEAFYWFELASRNGDADAQEATQNMFADGTISPEAAGQIRARAGAWRPTPPDAASNGAFPPQAWQTGSTDQIRKAQQVLNALGYSAGTPDGAIGGQTRAAIRAFETDQGKTPTGELSDETVNALNEATDKRRAGEA